MGKILGLDLINHPDLAALPENAVRIACEYWKSHNLNELADQDDIEAITHKINGGLNGLSDRITYTNRTDMTLSPLFPKDADGRIADNKGT